MDPLVSIIVPVYNAENYIERCVESILGQEYQNIEVILADDGSTDKSGRICDDIAEKDKRVIVIHKENTGVSDTRNIAIERAAGVYLQFVDSDDWLAPNATELLVRTARVNECDLVISDFYRVVGDRVSQKGDIEDDSLMTREEFAGYMMENPADFYYGVLWNKLYRREIIVEHNLRMDKNISWCEDFMFNLEYIRFAERFMAVQVPIYYYVWRKGSLVSQGASGISGTIKMKLTVFEYYNNFYKHILDEKDYEKNKRQVYRFLVDSAGDGVVLPAIFPSSVKLGEERISISEEAVAGEGIFMDDYRRRKFMEYCMESAAKKYSLSYQEIKILLYLSHTSASITKKELADIVGISRSSLSLGIKKLIGKNYIKIEDVKNPKGMPEGGSHEVQTGKRFKAQILSEAEPVMNEINASFSRYEHGMFSGFSEEELSEYARLEEKIKGNIQRVLQ